MDGDLILVLLILLGTVLLFVSDRIRLDVVALLSLLALTLTGILSPTEAIAGFSDPIVLMIAGLFVVSGGLFRTGVAARIGEVLGSVAGRSRLRLTAVLMIAAGTLSGFMSSTGTVAVMLPVTVTLAWRAGISPSKLLIPLSFASLLGGMLTLIGTPPNIVVANQLEAEGLAPFGFFDFTPVGAVMLAAGIAFMLAFGSRLLPERAAAGGDRETDGPPRVAASELVDGYRVGELARLRVRSTSPLVGRSPADAEVRRRYGASILRVQTRESRGPLPWKRDAAGGLRAGDLLDVQGSADAIDRLRREEHLATLEGSRDGSPLRLAEVLLPPRSRLIGRSLADARFRDRYGVHAISLRRLGHVVEDEMAAVPLRFGDTLLVTGPARRIDLLRRETGDFVVVAQNEDGASEGRLSRRALLAVGVMIGMMAMLTLEVVPAVTAVLLAAVLMVLVGALDAEAAYRSVNWESVVLIAGILPMATALENTGGLRLIAGQLAPLGALGPLAMAAALFLITSALSQVISNTATTVLIAPVAFLTSSSMGVSPYPLLMIVAVAASTAFATPIASPVNTLVLGPGEYRFGDYFRVGVALQALILVLSLLIVPLLFPF
jgi:di/tricarboxylate transporter